MNGVRPALYLLMERGAMEVNVGGVQAGSLAGDGSDTGAEPPDTHHLLRRAASLDFN